MARSRDGAAAPGEAPRLIGYRLLRGLVLFLGRNHRSFARGEFVLADDPVVPLLFRGGAVLEHVTR